MNARPARSAASSLPSASLALAVATALLVTAPAAVAQLGGASPPQSGLFRVELFGVQGLRSDLRLPNDSSAMRFALDSLTGAGPIATARIESIWPIGARSELRSLVAPLPIGVGTPWQVPGSAALASEPGADGAGPYRLGSYRLTWRYAWIDSPQLAVKLGVTARVRDGLLGQREAASFAGRPGIGLLPMLHASIEQTLTERMSLTADIDALAAPQGHAVDAGVRLRYALDRDWSASVSYRILDGGLDSAALPDAARLQYLGVGVRRAF